MEELKIYLPYWKELKPEEQDLLKRTAIRSRLDKNTVIYNRTMDCLGIITVISGQLRAYIVSEEGKEITLYRLLEQDTCLMSASCVMQNIDFEIQIEAKEESEIYIIPTPIYKQMMDQSIPFLKYMNQLLASRFSDVMWVMDQVLNRNMDERVGAYLVEQTWLNRSDILEITHEAIARELGTAREVITRMLKYLQTEGMVTLSRGHITVTDMQKLEELSRDSIR